jgi:hypothetical protein
MSATAWIVFAVVGGTVWGGFLFLLTFALRKERAKTRTERGLWVP